MVNCHSRRVGILAVLVVTTATLTSAIVSPAVASMGAPAQPPSEETVTSSSDIAFIRASGTYAAVDTGSGNISSRFDTGDGGWQISGDAQGSGTAPEYRESGGAPGGHICANDNVAGGTWYFSAPGKFLGDMVDAYGGTLAFDINQSSTDDQFSQDDIVLRNETRTIVYDFGNKSAHPGMNWTAYRVPMNATDPGWTYDSGGNVSPKGFRTLLSNLTTLAIRGEYVSGSDRGCLDTVRLSVDEQTTTGGDGDERNGSVRIISPTSNDEFARGDIVPIDLAFENTDRGTITFGDRDAHNIEINVTVRDTDGDGNATVYLNTFQVGHGYLRDGSNGGVPNFDSEEVASRNHGFFTLDEGTALEGEEGHTAIAHPTMDITGGSQGGVVMSGQYSYDLSSVAGEQPFTEVDVLDDRKQVNINPRQDDSMSLWTAPGAGVNAIDPETVDDIEAGIEAKQITPAAGVTVDQDLLIVEVNSEGMTGVFHEAILHHDDLTTADLFDQEGDTITKIWSGRTERLEWTAIARSSDSGETITEESLQIPLAQEKVLGYKSEDGVNIERFYFPVTLETGSAVTATERELEVGTELAVNFEFTREDAALDDSARNRFPGEDQQVTRHISFEKPNATIDPNWSGWNETSDRVEVSSKENVTIQGVTNVAAGSNLTVQVNSKAGQGEGSAFFDLQTRVYPQFDEDRDVQVWEVTNEDDFFNAEPGVEFEIKIRREGAAGNINPPPAIDGIVLDDLQVRRFEFTDKESLGEVVRVDELETNQGAFLVLTNENGNELGRTNRLAAGELHTKVAVSLDDQLDVGNHTITATVYRAEGEQYPVNSVETATISVAGSTEDLPAVFQVSEIRPRSTEIESPGDTLEVSATIRNTGEAEGTQEVVFRLGGEVQDTETVTLDGGNNSTVTFTADTSGLENGTSAVYSISTDNGSQSGSVSMVASDSIETASDQEGSTTTIETTRDEEDGTDVTEPGFGFGVPLLAIFLTVVYGLLRTQRK